MAVVLGRTYQLAGAGQIVAGPPAAGRQPEK
jgi:hypothetical protein